MNHPLEGKSDYLDRAEKALKDDEDRLEEYRQIVDGISELMDEELVFGEYHPLQTELRNFAPWMVHRLSAYVEMLETFHGDSVFEEDILPRLNQPLQYPGARLELEIAYVILHREFPVQFVDPQQSNRSPDLLVDDYLPIEIKQLQNPAHMVEQHRYYDEIQNVLYRVGTPSKILRAGNIYRPLAAPEKDEFIARIEKAAPRVMAGETVEIRQSILGEPIYEMFLAPHERESELETWLADRDFSGPLTGPAQRPNTIYRMRREIGEKVEQLPENQSGVVLIEADPFLVVEDRESGLLGMASELMKDVFDHGNLLALVILVRSNHFDMERLRVSRDNVRIADFETSQGFGYRTFLTIHNRYVEDPRGAELVDELFSG